MPSLSSLTCHLQITNLVSNSALLRYTWCRHPILHLPFEFTSFIILKKIESWKEKPKNKRRQENLKEENYGKHKKCQK